ncbi:hypothetical protein [Streptosporangium canum]|uniref:hypothetical protein n=1 Tax=Streptosporangium canum TaxID=324952 RepID=UPI001C434E03|nr:hypothetical protein [Streptosporangium canum]
MLLRLVYLTATVIFAFLRLLPKSDRDKEIEVLVLWRQLTILRRQVAKPAFTPSDRFCSPGCSAACRETGSGTSHCWCARRPSCVGIATCSDAATP